MGISVAGCGIGMPADVLSSEDLAERLEIDVTWITERTGIFSRRLASSDQSTATLAEEACRRALTAAGLKAVEIDTVIVATSTPDHPLPAVAPLVQHRIGAHKASAFDLNAGCAGFLYALSVASSMITSGAAERILVCGADVLARHVDHTDKKSCVLFGDGAGAVVLQKSEEGGALGPFALHSDGSGAPLLGIRNDTRLIHMEGREVYRWAVETMTASVTQVLDTAEIDPADVSLLVGHQANARILEAVAERLGMSDRAYINIGRWGNTSSASIPIALAEAASEGRLKEGDILVLTAFGSGFVWGAGLVRWGVPVRKSVSKSQAAFVS